MNNPNAEPNLLAEIMDLLTGEMGGMAARVVENARGARDSDIAWCRSSFDVPSTGARLYVDIRLAQMQESEETDVE